MKREKQKEIAGRSEYIRYATKGGLTVEESIAACCYNCLFHFTSRFKVSEPECVAYLFCPLYPFSPYQEGNVRILPYDHHSYEIDPIL